MLAVVNRGALVFLRHIHDWLELGNAVFAFLGIYSKKLPFYSVDICTDGYD